MSCDLSCQKEFAFFFLKKHKDLQLINVWLGLAGPGAACSASFRACHLHGFIRVASSAFNVWTCWFETICMPSYS